LPSEPSLILSSYPITSHSTKFELRLLLGRVRLHGAFGFPLR
jgi:hypothetical protein